MIRVRFPVYESDLRDYVLGYHFFYPIFSSSITDVRVDDEVKVSFSYTTEYIRRKNGSTRRESVELYYSLKFYDGGFVYVTPRGILKRDGEKIDEVDALSSIGVSPDGKYIGVGYDRFRLYSSSLLREKSYRPSRICIGDVVVADKVYSLDGELIRELSDRIYACALSRSKYYLLKRGERFKGALYDKKSVLLEASHRPIGFKNDLLLLHDFELKDSLYLYDLKEKKLYVAKTPRIAFLMGDLNEELLAIASLSTARFVDLERLLRKSEEKLYALELRETHKKLSARERVRLLSELVESFERAPVKALKRAESEGVIVEFLRILHSDGYIEQTSPSEFRSLRPPETVVGLKSKFS